MTGTARDLLLEVRHLTEAAHDAQAELLAASGLGAGERRLLDVLAEAGAPCTTRELARTMLCASSTMEASLRALQQRAWIGERCDGSHSTRTYDLTAAGRAARRAFQRAEVRLEEVVEAILDDDEVGRAIELLRRARRRLDLVRQARRLRPRCDVVLAGLEAAPRRLSALDSAGASVA